MKNTFLILAAIAPQVIELGEIKIEGDTERPMVSFVIPRAQFDFLDKKEFSDEKILISEITKSLESDVLKVQ
ncbi:MAG: hypothetical protein WCK49_00695 [Myxococcaceae bacterium]